MLGDTPLALAMLRDDQRVRPAGGCVTSVMISWRTLSFTLGLRPERFASANPAIQA